VSILDNLKKLFSGSKNKLPRIDVNKRFELLGRTGQGSMSKVWRARDRTLSRTVCLKVLDKEKTRKFDARFSGLVKPLEGAIATQLRHKNIVNTFEFGVNNEGEQCLVMELIEGTGLNFLIETKGKLLEGNRVAILTQMAEAFDFMHKAGYLHRDICPRNIMVTNEGQVKVIDFGLTIPYRPEFCKPGNRTGTPNYLAPELIKRTTTDHRVDLFAMGVTAYEVFTGQLPWEKAQSLQTLLSHMNSAGRNPLNFQPKLDKQTAAFLTKAVERDPAQRYQSAEEFRDALRALPKQ
jgi:eukaryotic-like serine/threonine-protein kinase